MYKFCFHNPYSTPETVSFNIHVGHIPNEHNIAKDGLWNSLSICFHCVIFFSTFDMQFEVIVVLNGQKESTFPPWLSTTMNCLLKYVSLSNTYETDFSFISAPLWFSLTFRCSFVAEHLDPINVKIAELREALESVTLEQKYLKARDVRHRHSKFLSLFTKKIVNVAVMLYHYSVLQLDLCPIC